MISTEHEEKGALKIAIIINMFVFIALRETLFADCTIYNSRQYNSLKQYLFSNIFYIHDEMYIVKYMGKKHVSKQQIFEPMCLSNASDSIQFSRTIHIVFTCKIIKLDKIQ